LINNVNPLWWEQFEHFSEGIFQDAAEGIPCILEGFRTALEGIRTHQPIAAHNRFSVLKLTKEGSISMLVFAM
jgi:hypothetical protein